MTAKHYKQKSKEITQAANGAKGSYAEARLPVARAQFRRHNFRANATDEQIVQMIRYNLL